MPRNELADLLETMIAPAVTCHSDSIEWRLYRQADGTQKLVLIAAKFRRMRGIVRFAGREIEFSDGLQALLTSHPDGTFTIRGEALNHKIQKT